MFRLAASFVAVALAKELTNADFDDHVFNSGKNSIVKFQAPWWGHCKSMKPAYDKLAAAYADTPSVGIFDVEQNKIEIEILKNFEQHFRFWREKS